MFNFFETFEKHIANLTFNDWTIFLITNIFFAFLICIIISCIVNRRKLKLYQIVITDNGINKIGISWLILIILLSFQVLSGKEISSSLVELLLITFGTELGTKYLDRNVLQNKNNIIDDIEKYTEDIDLKKEDTAKAKVDDVDY